MTLPAFIELPNGDLLKTERLNMVLSIGDVFLSFFHEELSGSGDNIPTMRLDSTTERDAYLNKIKSQLLVGNAASVESAHPKKQLSLDDIAMICHEANKAICEVYGDQSQPDWGSAEQWQKDATMESIQFALNNPDATPKDQHDQWCKQKIADGWVFGEEKNAERKTHPCLVGYEELPKHQQAKDAVFQVLVKKLGALLNDPLIY